MSGLFASGGQTIRASASVSVLPMNMQGWLPLGLTGWMSLLSKELSRVFSSTTIQALWQAISKMAYTKGHLPGLLLPVACPWGEPLLIHTSAGASCEVPAPFPYDWCTQDFICALHEWSLFLLVLWKSCNQFLLALKVRFPGDFKSLCQKPRMGHMMRGSEPAQQWENFLGTTGLQFMGFPLSSYRIWFHHDCAPPAISLDIFFFLADSRILLLMDS